MKDGAATRRGISRKECNNDPTLQANSPQAPVSGAVGY